MTKWLMLVMTEPAVGKEDEFNDWYTNVHMPEVLTVPGFEAAQRFVADSTVDDLAPPRRYLTVYEYSLDRSEIQAGLRAGHESGAVSDVSDAIDQSSTIQISVHRAHRPDRRAVEGRLGPKAGEGGRLPMMALPGLGKNRPGQRAVGP